MKRIVKQQVERLYDAVDLGIICFDVKGNVVCANAMASILLGRTISRPTVEQDIGIDRSAVDGGSFTSEAERYPAAEAVRTGSKVKDFHMDIYNPTLKEHRWFAVDAYPIYETGEVKPDLAYIVFRDVTQQRSTDRELHQIMLHLALAQEISGVGSAAVDFKTGKWDWSDETFRIYGVGRDTFTPSAATVAGLVHPDDWAALYINVPRAQQNIEPDPVAEYRIRRPDGAERILRRMATAVKNAAGTITGIVATVQDVTDLRVAQRANKDLQKQLYHAQRLDALGTLAGGVAHDLNNTLVPVVALTDLVLQSLDADDPNRPLIELVKQGGQRASELVEQVIAFAKREAPEHELIEVRPFLQQLLRLIHASVPGNIKIIENIPDAIRISGNRGQLHQVFLNLISNAIHAIGDKSGFVYLSTVIAQSSEPGETGQKRFVQISVADTGCGIPLEVQSRVFEPFFTTKRVGEGTGLGLSVAHGIVLSHNGSIRVQSAPGEGARFDVLLPAPGEPR
jgi:PAS domain S-box-containing protein